MKRTLTFLLCTICILVFSKFDNDSLRVDSLKTRSFSELDKRIALKELFNKSGYAPYSLSDEIAGDNDSIYTKIDEIFDFCLENQKFAESITGMEEISLPIGLTGNTSDGFLAQMVIVKAKVTPEYLEFSAFAKVQTQYQGIELYFAAEGLKLSHQGGVIDTWKLHLLGRNSLPLFGGKMLFSLIGSTLYQGTGNFVDQSYIEFDCDGFKQFAFKSDIRIDRSLVIPVNEQGNRIAANSNESLNDLRERAIGDSTFVGCQLDLTATGWNDFLIQTSLPDFEAAGLEYWTFNVENAVFDLSDSQNSPNIEFPAIYQENNLFPGGNQNAWRGFYANEINVILPPEFKENNQQNRTQFSAQNLILDNNGVSGNFGATYVVDKGNASGWRFKVDSIDIDLELNSLVNGSIKGSIKPGSLDSNLGFRGVITPENYIMTVSVDSADIKMLKGRMVFQENSFLTMIVDRPTNKFKADAHLNGWLNITGNIGDTPTDSANAITDDAMIDFEGIVFNGLHLSSYEYPYITAEYFGYPGELEISGFPVSFGNVHMIEPIGNSVGIEFNLSINLMEAAGIAAETKLQVLAQSETEEFRTFKFHEINLEALQIDVERSGFKLYGGLEFFRDDPDFGNGFRGNLSIKVDKIGAEGTAKGLFAKSDFRFWYADFEMTNSNVNNGKLKLEKLEGGLSYKMKRTDGTMLWALNTAKYVPDVASGFGLRAGARLKFGSRKSFEARAYLELEYNNSGGLNRIYFLGEGALMGDGSNEEIDDPGESGSGGPAGDALDQILAQYESGFNDPAQQALYDSFMAQGNLLEIAKRNHPVSEIAQNGKIGAYVSIEKDFVNNTFDGLFEIYINTIGLKGTGTNNKAGWAHIYSSPSQSYVHVGTPMDRLGVKFSIGAYDLTVGGYFMSGDVLPTQIAPHARVIEILGADILNDNRDFSLLNDARGFAFGLNFELSKSINLGWFYANLEAGAGFDVMRKHFPGVSCAGMDGPLGNDGWYSMGQVYAYLYGEFGLKVKVMGIKRRIKILQAGVAAMLMGEFPNPSHFKGYVGAYYNALGGLIKGRIRFKVEFGEECNFEGMSDALGVNVIGDIDPDGEVDVDVFKIPQVAFNFPVNEQFTIDTEEATKTVRIKLVTFNLTHQGEPLEGTLEWEDNNTKLNFIALDILPPETEIQGMVKVQFEERIGNSWQLMTENGQPSEEFRNISFTTSTAPGFIPLHNIAYAYPVPDENNFYPNEHQTSYIKLKQGQPYLFEGANAAWTIKGEMYQGEQRLSQNNISYDFDARKVIFNYDNIGTSSNYNINIMAYAPGVDPEEIDANDLNQDPEEYSNEIDNATSANNDEEEQTTIITDATATAGNMEDIAKSLLEYNFSTSQFATFTEKVNSLDNTGNLVEIIYADVHALHYETPTYEVFNESELAGSLYTSDTPLIRVEAVLTNEMYYQDSIKYLIYQEYPLDGNITLDRSIDELGFPPVKANDIPAYYLEQTLDGNTNSSLINQRLPYRYNMPWAYKQDFIDLRYKIVNRYLPEPVNWDKYYQYEYLIEGSFPSLPIGNYKIKIIYAPKGNEFSSEVIRTYIRPY